MVMTYNSLSDQIIQTLNRNDADTIAQVPNFVFFAEQRISKELEHIGLVGYASGSLTPGVNVISKPAKWLRNETFQIGTGENSNKRKSIYLRTYGYIRTYWPDDSILGEPVYYGDYDVYNFIIAPTPDFAYPFELSSYNLPEPLGPSVSTNWLTNYVPNLLFYACLIEASSYIKTDQRTPYWKSIYDGLLAGINAQDKKRFFDLQINRDSD